MNLHKVKLQFSRIMYKLLPKYPYVMICKPGELGKQRNLQPGDKFRPGPLRYFYGAKGAYRHPIDDKHGLRASVHDELFEVTVQIYCKEKGYVWPNLTPGSNE